LSADDPTVEISIKMAQGTISELPEHFDFLDSNAQYDVKHPHWVRVDLLSPKSQHIVLVGGKLYMKNLRFFDENFRSIGEGSFAEAKLVGGTNTFYIYYPFLDQKEANGVSVTVARAVEFYRGRDFMSAIHIAFVSLVFFLFMLSLAFYIVSRFSEGIYLIYALYLFSIFYFFAYQFGVLGSIFTVVNQIHPTWLWISSASITATYVLFSQSFLNIKQADPLLNRVLNYGLIYVMILVFAEVISFMTDSDLQHFIGFTVFSLTIQLTTMIFALYRVYQMRTLLSRIFLVGAAILVLTTLGGQLASSFKLAEQTNLFVMIALILEVFIFNVGIGVRMVLINKEKQLAQIKLIEQLKINKKIQEENTEELEKKVKYRTEELSQKNNENELLLGEIHHRVKNNLQTIVSLLNIQQRKLKDPDAKEAIMNSQSRVKTMGLIHEHLYQNGSFSNINLQSYLKHLVNTLLETNVDVKKKIKLNFEVEEIRLDIDTAIPLGLIVNELVSNSIKHALGKNLNPALDISLQEKNDHLTLVVKDNGTTDTKEIDSKHSFGWQLIHALADKLESTISTSFNSGLMVKIDIKKYKLN